ncbi:MAG: glutaredoxin [Myxococcales bacterium]|nr:glutaredoxin [Myxococcales bacterium]
MPAPVVVYRTRTCPYCVLAGHLLDRRRIAYTEVFLDGKPAERAALQARTQFMTVPQVFVGSRFIGGYTDLARLDVTGELQRLVAEGA